MPASDNSSCALPTRDELNRTLLEPPFECRFCGVSGGDFLGLLVHSLGVHPINYILLREHVQAHGSDDGFHPLDLSIPERPRVFKTVSSPRQEAEIQTIPSHESSIKGPSVELLEIGDMDLSDVSGDQDSAARSDKQSTAQNQIIFVASESCAASTPTEADSLCIVNEGGDGSGSKSASSPKRRATSRSKTPARMLDKSRSAPLKMEIDRPDRLPYWKEYARTHATLKAWGGQRAARCEHNQERCPLFPYCQGRHCPRQHPPCHTGGADVCLRRNDCPFEHAEYEKTCSQCADRVSPPHTSILIFHCPHNKLIHCRYKCGYSSGDCSYLHGDCKEPKCSRRQRCKFEHIGDAVFYMCKSCIFITNSFKSGSFML